MWKTESVNVMLSYTGIQWRRETDEVVQILDAMIWNDGTMTLCASESWHGSTKAWRLDMIPREYITTQENITAQFYRTCFKGQTA